VASKGIGSVSSKAITIHPKAMIVKGFRLTFRFVVVLLFISIPPHLYAVYVRPLTFITWILHESEVFIGKASKGEVVVVYFEPLATQHMEASGSPEGRKLIR
jgi:hypothetical protein